MNNLLLKQTLYFENNMVIDLSDLSKFTCDKDLHDLLLCFDGRNNFDNIKEIIEKKHFNTNLRNFEDIINNLIKIGVLIPRSYNEGASIETRKLEKSIEKGIKFLNDSQTQSGNFGTKGFFDVWETANALLAMHSVYHQLNSDVIKNGLDFLKKHQQENGRFHWGSTDNKLFCTETTALCGLVFTLYGLEENAEKAWMYLKKTEDWYQVFDKQGNKLFHKFPSILGYILNFAVYHDEKLVEDNLEYFQGNQNEVGSWGVHASYFQSEFYAIKEIISVLNKYSINSTKTQELVSLYQNYDGGYGFSTNPFKSDALPTSMALRSIIIQSVDQYMRDMVNKGINWLINNQNYNGAWISNDSQMYAMIPDEYTDKLIITKGFNVIKKLHLLKYVLHNKARLMREFPSKLFYLQRVSDYSTSVFTTSQALIALNIYKKSM